MIAIQFNEAEKISMDTMRAMFAAVKKNSPNLSGDFESFVIGMRAYERLLKMAGCQPWMWIDGMVIQEGPKG